MSNLEKVVANIERRLNYYHPDYHKITKRRGTYFTNLPPPIKSWTWVRNPIRIAYNAGLLEISKYIPSPRLKNLLFRHLGIKIGKNSTVAPRVQFDYFYPELIEIGDYCVIGDGARIWTHDYGIAYFAVGETKIGNYVLIGSEAIIAGSNIEDHSKIKIREVMIGRKK